MIAESKIIFYKGNKLRTISLMIIAAILAQGIACCVAPPQIIVLKPNVNQFDDKLYEVYTVADGKLTLLTSANLGEYLNVYEFLDGNSCNPGTPNCNEATYPLLKLGDWKSAQWIAMKVDSSTKKITPHFGNTDPKNMEAIKFADLPGNKWLYLYLFTS